MTIASLASVLLICSGIWSVLAAQTVTVALSVSEKTGGLFESAFGASLRSLGDVNVVTVSEPAEFVMRVVVLCEPYQDRCSEATRYAVAIDWASQLESADARMVVMELDTTLFRAYRGDSPKARQAMSEAERRTAKAYQHLQGYEKYQSMIVASWGRDGYRRAIEEVATNVDRNCLELKRLFRRSSDALIAHDYATFKNLSAVYQAKRDERKDGEFYCT